MTDLSSTGESRCDSDVAMIAGFAIRSAPSVVFLSVTRRIRLRHLVAALTIVTWFYLAGLTTVAFLLRASGDRWWLATVLLFGPRWPYAVPWVPLVFAASAIRRRLLWPLAAAAVILLGPIMGLCVPWPNCFEQDCPTIRVVTCNVHGTAVDGRRFAELVNDVRPDVVALQEYSGKSNLKWPANWNVVDSEGLLLASPHPLTNWETTRRRVPNSSWTPINAVRCVIKTPQGAVSIACVHLQTPRRGIGQVLDRATIVNPARSVHLTEDITKRRCESEAVAQWLGTTSWPWIAAGDFNMPVESAIYRDVWAGRTNAFSAAGFGFGYTKWTPLFGHHFGARIDHVLAGPRVTVRRCWVGTDVGSDHLPVIADLVVPTQTSPATRCGWIPAGPYDRLAVLPWHTKSPNSCWSMPGRSWNAPRRFGLPSPWECLCTKSRPTSTGSTPPKALLATHPETVWRRKKDKTAVARDLEPVKNVRVTVALRRPFPAYAAPQQLVRRSPSGDDFRSIAMAQGGWAVNDLCGS